MSAHSPRQSGGHRARLTCTVELEQARAARLQVGRRRPEHDPDQLEAVVATVHGAERVGALGADRGARQVRRIGEDQRQLGGSTGNGGPVDPVLDHLDRS